MAPSNQPTTDPVEAPERAYTLQRFMPATTVQWVQECDEIMMSKGLVRGKWIYEKRKTARNRAERLIKCMVDLNLHERWQLMQHVEQYQGGYKWSVEYRGGKDNGRRAEATAA